MPYASDRQRRFLHARHPGIAAKWDEEIRQARKNRVAKAQRRKDRSAAYGQAAVGGVLAGTGLIAGGVPGAREPEALGVFRLRGRAPGSMATVDPRWMPGTRDPRAQKSRLSPVNIGYNGRVMAGQAGAGILGFRTGMHDAFITLNRDKTGGTPYVQGMRRGKLEAEREIVRGMRMARRGTYGLTIGGALLGAHGVRRARGKVDKRDNRRRNVSAAMLGGGAAVAGVGHFVPAGLQRFERKYTNSAKGHVLAAERLAPHFGGLKVEPAQYGDFGETRRPARQTMYPQRTDAELRQSGAADRLKGGTAVEVGRHRGLATQERHFSEAFRSTRKAVRRARGPGLALAGAGATGVWASRGERLPGGKGRVSKSTAVQPERHFSPLRAMEAAAGVALLGWGAPRTVLARSTLHIGRKIPGNFQSSFNRAEKIRQGLENASGKGTRMVGSTLGEGHRVPRLRPWEATAGGGLLIRDAMPVRRVDYQPIKEDRRTGGRR